ncbi:glycerophosphodiester phosphodiesterase family protein [Marinifilum caeruleilacunae]|uniref:Glycerophosphodiester phosphodiesterase family protein n=1 Tax=Marinifilum caeruleilacunae TaxID=2499076 RepID=A0ABX1WRI0_9BACT|nr:glycerophosphodiester phosphodiesterase family protein [Marinifilum caeruleilacunae]NOU58709.1 glycerophosphodiester phosphodiesterase family protein [Marinifilum caeruleilacunae]
MNKILLVLSLAISCFACCTECKKNDDKVKNKDTSVLLDEYVNGSNVLVIAHRGDWRNACENSILAIENAIKMGVDIVEIDLKRTSDKQLILMHDHTLDRTTTGSGKVKDHTLKEIQELFLKDGAGHRTEFKIPTLKEALLSTKGKILVNLDQSYKYFEEVLPILKETGTMNQVIMKGYNVPIEEVKSKLGVFYDSIQYMPIIKLGAKGYKERVLEVKKNHFEAVEFTFTSDTIPTVHEFFDFQEKGTRVWVNSLWSHHNSGHHDDRAYTENPDVAYGWLVSKGINMIQTDRPQLLLEYLRSKGLHQ